MELSVNEDVSHITSWNHVSHGPLDDLIRMLLLHFLERNLVKSSCINCVVPVNLSLSFLSSHKNVININNDNFIAIFQHILDTVVGFVLSSDVDGCSLGYSSERISVSIEQMPCLAFVNHRDID